jgi:hypothetical protein
MMIVQVGPSQFNIENPNIGKKRLFNNPRLDVKNIPAKQYLI